MNVLAAEPIKRIVGLISDQYMHPTISHSSIPDHLKTSHKPDVSGQLDNVVWNGKFDGRLGCFFQKVTQLATERPQKAS